MEGGQLVDNIRDDILAEARARVLSIGLVYIKVYVMNASLVSHIQFKIEFS